MVWLTDILSFLEASCWRVDVVNGAAGVLDASFFSMSEMLNSAPMHFSRKVFALSISGNLVSSTALTIIWSAVPSGWNIASTL